MSTSKISNIKCIDYIYLYMRLNNCIVLFIAICVNLDWDKYVVD